MSPISRFTLVPLLCAVGPVALACDCSDRYLNAHNGREKATFVFSGEPVSKQGHYGDMLYNFRIESVWKGALLKQSLVHGGMDSCGFAFRVGTTYLVYGYAGKGTKEEPVKTSICSSNKELVTATQDVKVLGKALTVYEHPRGGAGARKDPATAAGAQAASAAQPAPPIVRAAPIPPARHAPLPPVTPRAPVPTPPPQQPGALPSAAPTPATGPVTNPRARGAQQQQPVNMMPPVQSTPGPNVAPAPSPAQ